jgi:inosine/xanthosine triphosphate pyrophosphatase family protein
MNLKKINFLTTNAKKAKDFQEFGFGVQEFDKEIPEILSQNVELVVLHKAKDTGLNNIVVEDTALHVEGADFLGTEIKHCYEKIQNNSNFHDKKALWEVSLCFKKDDNYYISTGHLSGILMYPACPTGYHFDTIFATLNKHYQFQHFENLTTEEKLEKSPRFKALRKLMYAIEHNDFQKLKIYNERDIQDWTGLYQEEKNSAKKIKIC